MAISDDLNSIRTHLEDDYTALETLGVSVEDRNIENIKDMANQIYAKFPKTDYAEGSNITLSNTLKGKLDFEDGIVGYGDTKQTQYKGYNLFHYTLASLKTLNTTGTWNDNKYTLNGLTFTVNNDLTISVNGTSTANTDLILEYKAYTNGTTYTIWDGQSDNAYGKYTLLIASYSYWGENIIIMEDISRTFTAQSNQSIRTGLTVYNNNTLSNVVFKPMLYLGNYDSTKDYEPYVGNSPSPSPSYPQDIEVVRGKNRVETTPKGYWDNNGYWIDTNYNCSSNKIEVQEGKTYVGSIFDKNKNYINKMVYVVFDKNDTFIRYSGDDTVTIANGEKYVSIRSYNAQKSYVENDNYLIQFEENTRHTSYLPYNTLEVVERGKNILNIADVVEGYISGADGSIVSSSTYNEGTIAFIKVKPNTTYTVKMFETNWSDFGRYNWFAFGEYTTNNTSGFILRTTSSNPTQDYLTITTSSTTQYLSISARGLLLATKVQLEENSQATTYEPYITPITKQLSLGEYEFAKIGNYVDTIEYDVDEDKVYKNEKIGKYTFTGNETIVYQSGNNRFAINNIINNLDVQARQQIYSNRYKFIESGSADYGMFTYWDTSVHQVFIYHKDYTSPSDLSTYYANNNTFFYYIRNNLNKIEITGTLADQIKALYYSHSFTGTTIIEIDGQLPLIIKVRALKGE